MRTAAAMVPLPMPTDLSAKGGGGSHESGIIVATRPGGKVCVP